MSLTACAAGIEPLGSDVQQTRPAWLVGTWEGSGYQVGASNTQGEGPITMTFADEMVRATFGPAMLSLKRVP